MPLDPIYLIPAAVFSLAPFALARLRSRDFRSTAMFWFGTTLCVGVLGQSALLVGAYDGELLSGERSEILQGGIVLVGIAVVFVGVGYLCSMGSKSLQVRAPEVGAPWARSMVVLLLLVSLVGLVLFLPRVGITDLDSLLVSRKRFVQVEGGQSPLGYHRLAMSMAGVAALLMLVIGRIPAPTSAKWLDRVLSISCWSVAVLVSWTTSSRSSLLELLAIAFVFRTLATNQTMSLRRLVPVAVAAIVLLTLFGNARLAGQQRANETGFEGVTAVANDLFGSRDWVDIGPLSVVHERVPDEFAFTRGSSAVSVLVAPVPRQVWESKPPLSLGPVIATPVFGLDSTSRLTGDSPDLISELWINWGWAAVVLGSVAYGVLLGVIDRSIEGSRYRGPASVMLMSVLVITAGLRLPSSGVAMTVVASLQVIGPLLLIFYVLRRRDADTLLPAYQQQPAIVLRNESATLVSGSRPA